MSAAQPPGGSSAFEWIATELEQRTPLSRLEARGTVRLVLKDLGLDPSTVSTPQMQVVIQRLLAPALVRRRVEGADDLCAALSRDLADQKPREAEPGEDTAYDFFQRLGDGARKGPR